MKLITILWAVLLLLLLPIFAGAVGIGHIEAKLINFNSKIAEIELKNGKRIKVKRSSIQAKDLRPEKVYRVRIQTGK